MKALVDATLTAGGVTFYASTLQRVEHANGFYVGGAKPTVTIPESEFTSETLQEAIRDVSGYTRFIGTWVHEGYVYVDAVTYVRDARQARQTAIDRGEKAIYDIAGNTELMVDAD